MPDSIKKVFPDKLFGSIVIFVIVTLGAWAAIQWRNTENVRLRYILHL